MERLSAPECSDALSPGEAPRYRTQSQVCMAGAPGSPAASSRTLVEPRRSQRVARAPNHTCAQVGTEGRSEALEAAGGGLRLPFLTGSRALLQLSETMLWGPHPKQSRFPGGDTMFSPSPSPLAPAPSLPAPIRSAPEHLPSELRGPGFVCRPPCCWLAGASCTDGFAAEQRPALRTRLDSVLLLWPSCWVRDSEPLHLLPFPEEAGLCPQ